MEKKQELNFPPDYIKLGYDSLGSGAPSAPTVDDGASASGSNFPGPSAPSPTICPSGPSDPPPEYEEAASSKGDGIPIVPTAPPTDPNLLKCTPPSLLFEDIFEACIQYVKSNCCYSSRFARQMKLTSIENKCAFRYTLESFGEKRESATKCTPYKGGAIDGPENGRPPDPWDITVIPGEYFQKGKRELIIPHTDVVTTCSTCSGSGSVTCFSCGGSGRSSCSSCGGSGRNAGQAGSQGGSRSCTSCGGSGRRSCFSCGGSGRNTCSTCDGYGKVKNYKVLIVTWQNHVTDYMFNNHKVPSKKMKEVTGEALVSDTGKKLSPIVNAPEAAVNLASARMLDAHRNSFPNELIIKQRHRLDAIPFTVAKYKWSDEEGEFYVYGKEKEVYFECYPTNCCCICC